MEIKYYSPSYKRGKICKTQETYTVFEYVIAEKEAGEYSNKKYITIPDYVQGNISRVRNYILSQNTENAVVMMDDDCDGIYRWQNCKSIKLEEEQFVEFCENMIEMILDAKLMYGGVNIAAPSDKGAYREYTPFSFISPVLGPFCIHVKNKYRYDENMPLKEDYDMSLQQLYYNRGILRANAYSYKVKQADISGGCSAMRNSAEERRQYNMLLNKWGSNIIKYDIRSRREFDFNPIIKVPYRGV